MKAPTWSAGDLNESVRESIEPPRCGDLGRGKFCLLHQGGGPESERKPALCNPRDSLPEMGPSRIAKQETPHRGLLADVCLEKEPAALYSVSSGFLSLFCLGAP